ncbi:Ger(x)C family spore germination C-terminal domain-containing protein [Paenibacillus sp. 1001270B_150601_E10]|uniref:Ger(x)C family spore germination C-terminal domain-containing protein n=1 Tax=Paenibacillus sp. 1001270B_150601_E10 TaxID=2787079 RepID=UPI0018A0E9FB|nr:Ger(x)C family spore germination C-terminal domain-containing protein [Paenibacillus sp. 1001270B_150601_E10]
MGTTSIKSIHLNGKPIILIQIKVQSNVGEVNANIDVMDPKVILTLEKLTEQAIQTEVERSISRLQAMKSDIFDFGDIVHRQQPALWDKVKHDWSESTFTTLQYDVNVSVNIPLLGMRKNPLIQSVQ